jgi:peroxiredoxin
MCRVHLVEVQKIYGAIRERGGEVLVISFTPPSKVATYLAKYPLPFPIASDPTLAAYRAFALEKTSVGSMLRPGVLLRFIGALLRFRKLDLPARDDDLMQLGGDFVLDADGRLTYARPSREPTDRPDAAELLQAVTDARKN